MQTYINLAIVLAVAIVPFLVGNYLARKIRMPDYGWKLGLILCAFAASITIISMGRIKLGYDLSGGVQLVYQVDRTSAENKDKSVDIKALVRAVSQRINPGGKEMTIRPYGSDGVEIIIPDVNPDELDAVKRTIVSSGMLEFRILADDRDPRHRAAIEAAKDVPAGLGKVTDADANVLGWWVPVENRSENEFRNVPHLQTRQTGTAQEPVLEVLVVADEQNVTGGYLSSAASDRDQNGTPAVSFTFNAEGATKFRDLTSANTPDPVIRDFHRLLGIILDDKLQSAPQIRSAISARGQITGHFTEAQVTEYVNILNAGSLPAALAKEPISQLNTGATLGSDTIHNSAVAMIISSILVPLFMLWYYRFSGMVANVALLLNMLMLVAVMMIVKAAFTLPGLAGLALTVGMAVDNNVLIYERLREELRHGAALRMAIRNAFHRAGVVIVDANITHLIAATVLWVVGTEQVKGFAVTFWLGAVLSMWTALFVARAAFEIAERRQWITKLKMMHVITETKIDFMNWFPAAATFSVLITVAGLLVAWQRGQGLFDIDFTGGSAVQVLFREDKPQEPDVVRKTLHPVLPDLAVNNVQQEDEAFGLRYMVNTSERDLAKVEETIQQAFGDKLVTNTMTVDSKSLIEAVKPEKPAPAKPGAKPPGKAEEKPAPKPAAKQQSRHDLPPETMLALAGPAPVLVAQSSPPEVKSAAAPGKDPAKDQPPVAEEKNRDKEKPPAAPDKAAAAKETSAAKEKPAEAKPAATPAKEKPAEAKPAAPPGKEKPVAKAETPAKPAPAKKPRPPRRKERETAEPARDPYLGGTQAQVTFAVKVNQATIGELMTAALRAKGFDPEAVGFSLLPSHPEPRVTAYNTWNLKIKLPPDKAQGVLGYMQSQLSAKPYFPGASRIGEAVAEGTRWQAVYALVASWVLIIIYLWVRFQGVAFGLAAVIALIHDVLVMLGAIAFSYYLVMWLPGVARFLKIDSFKINLPIVAAFMTIIGYSVNDTIVVFDRIREVRGKDPRMTRQMVNDSTNQTLSRTLLTSFTVLLVVVILYLFGGDAIRGFAFALVVGVLTGTYSSIYVAAPILLWLIHPKEMRAERPEAAAGLGRSR